GQEVADLAQEGGIGINIEFALVAAMPGVDLALQVVTYPQQLAVLRREVAQDGGQPRPKRIRIDPGLGRCLLGDEIVEDRGNLQSMGFDTLHDGLFSWELAAARGPVTTNNAAKGRYFPGLLAPKAGP